MRNGLASQLGLRNGNFAADGDATKMLLKGRYHDGHVKCTDDADPSTCHGFLQAVYAHDFSGEANMFFRRFQSDRPTPVTMISNATVEGAMFLEKAHESLTEYHKYAANANGYTYADAVQKVEKSSKPYFAVLATWSAATRGAGAGWHGWTDLRYKEEAENPLADLRIHTINEAFSNVQGWADGSLQRADEVLQSVWDVPTPWSFTVTDLPQIVRQTVAPPAACEETAGGVVGGGGGGAPPVEEEDPLCFAGDARLAMADGSTVALRDAQVGDRISTGVGVGVVTAKLVHPVNKQVRLRRVLVHGVAPSAASRNPNSPATVFWRFLEGRKTHATATVQKPKAPMRLPIERVGMLRLSATSMYRSGQLGRIVWR
jgi:hypothetical protein